MRVVGPSMEPTLSDGDQVLVDRARRPDPGDLALASPPGQPDLEVVKRVGRVTGDGRYWLISDNPERGVDSRRWGAVPATGIKGRATLNLSRPAAPLAGRPRPSWTRWLLQ